MDSSDEAALWGAVARAEADAAHFEDLLAARAERAAAARRDRLERAGRCFALLVAAEALVWTRYRVRAARALMRR